MTKIIVVAAQWPLVNPATPSFTDVDRNSAFYLFVETAACHSIISGYGDGTFRPGAYAGSESSAGRMWTVMLTSVISSVSRHLLRCDAGWSL